EGGVLGGILGGPTQATERKILQIGAVKPPKLIRDFQPVYPPAALAMGLSGKVVVEVIINENGEVENARILQSNSHIFDEAALDAARKWKFSPPTDERGQKVAVYFIRTITFKSSNQ
ncbi:MAG: energy transducer TonB, partial [Acidobacteria bacterium]|nr:energy transducer TonB [Acidobacteriota bacterium]